jgi:glycosyl transferase family 90
MKRVPFRSKKSIYYITRKIGILLPEFLFRRLQKKHIRYRPGDPCIEERVNYYNKLRGVVPLTDGVSDLRTLKKGRKTTYYYDLYETARYFEPHRKFRYQFGDVRDIPPHPTFVKSRPIAGDNANSVLLKLNKIRHFNFVRDPYRLDQKKDALVWRGNGRGGDREHFLRKFIGKPGFDIGRIVLRDEVPELWRPFLPVGKQLQYKFICSIEGIDVASNLKWIMSSNSICLMKKPLFETWFMEGTLVPGEHYVLMNDDFSDVEEKMEYYLGRPKEMREIVDNAHRYVSQFLDPALERQISLLVMQKYFEHTV